MVNQTQLKQESMAILDSLQTWVQSSGAYMHNVKIEERSSGNRGLFATQPLSPGTAFLRIPASLLITCKKARQQPHIVAIFEAVKATGLDQSIPDATSDSAALLLFVMAEFVKGPSSRWYAWFKSLPSVFWTPVTIDEDFAEDLLTGTTLLTLANTLRQEIQEMYDDWFVPFAMNEYPHIYPSEKCKLSSFMYVHCVIDSRAFKIDDVTILAPFADMANHRSLNSPARNAKVRGWLLDEAPHELGLEMHVTDRSVSAGEELCISYGALANWQLLLHYGFTIQNNSEDSIMLSLQVPDDDSPQLHTRKMLFLNMNMQGDLDVHHTLSITNPLPLDLLASARLLLLNEEEGEGVTVQNANFSKRISVRNENAVVANLTSLLEAMLSGFDLFEDGDGEGLQQDSFAWFCRTYVHGQADILEKTMQALKNLSSETS